MMEKRKITIILAHLFYLFVPDLSKKLKSKLDLTLTVEFI
ncbi:MAG: hypothetical protein ACD_60C00012G0001, partial [uncultured bacterium]